MSQDFKTDKQLQSLKSRCSGKVHYYGGRLPYPGSLGIRISPKGKCSWMISYRFDGTKTKYTFGQYPSISLKAAIKQATALLKGVDEGVEPNAIRKAEKASPLMAELWDTYQKQLANRKNPKSAAMMKEEERKWNKIVSPRFGTKKVKDVKPHQLHDLLEEIASEFPVAANRLHSFLSVLFKPALSKGWITVHPLQFIDKPAGGEAPRKRVLSDAEIKAVWPVFGSSGDVGDILKLCLLTAQRSGEIKTMKWEDINLGQAVWMNRDTKAGSDNLVPLSEHVLKVLEPRSKASEWVFSSNRSKSGHIVNINKPKKEIQKKSETTGWTIHDLRRTSRTLMSRIKVEPHICERVLNHSQGGVVGVYDQHNFLSEKRLALDKLAREIDRITGIKVEGKIIKMRRAV